MNIPLALVDRSLGLQTRVTFEVINCLRRLAGFIRRTRGEMLVTQSNQYHNTTSSERKRRTYEGSISGIPSSLGFFPSVLVHLIGELASRRFSLGPLSGRLPSFVRGVRTRLDWILGRHDYENDGEVDAGCERVGVRLWS